MPRTPRTPKSLKRIKRHFHPLITRSAFSPERLLTPPPMVWNTSFPFKNRGDIPVLPLGSPEPESDDHGQLEITPKSAQKIKKPAGEPARPGRGGFVMKHALGLDDAGYTDLQVNSLIASSFSKTDVFVCRILFDSWLENIWTLERPS